MAKITAFVTHDVRFPTSLRLDGSDAMNPSPDYSAAYLIIRTDEADPADAGGEPLSGHSFVFTIGPGNDVQLAAIRIWSGSWSAATWTRSSPTWAACTGRWWATARCAGWGPNAASRTWRSAPS